MVKLLYVVFFTILVIAIAMTVFMWKMFVTV